MGEREQGLAAGAHAPGQTFAGRCGRSKSTDAFDNSPGLAQVWKPTGGRRKEVLKASGALPAGCHRSVLPDAAPSDQRDRCSSEALNALKKAEVTSVET
ncbi:hypothetical protein ACN6AT_35650 (plasmid) [Streptomyces sp. JL4002]|uniref:hypothetical protein n=1 Tax=Streptomyces sp. JL4002 TaxID=3404781 RepID=UPI003B28D9FE